MMKDDRSSLFIGRKAELAELERFSKKKTASLIVIKGRRRIGKSRLIEEFAKTRTFYSFIGLPPNAATTAQSQRDEFAKQLSFNTGLPEIKADDWSKLFALLAQQVRKNKVVLLFDEISWMGSEDSDFLGKIKNAWDNHFKKNPHLIFIICGSASSWIEKNILSSTGFLGRVSYTMTLHELLLKECDYFWGKYADRISSYEKLKILSVVGGVPKYLEEIDPALSAEENIKNLCFKPGALLVDEFNNIFNDLFLRDSAAYRKIVAVLVSGIKEPVEIARALNIQQSGKLSEYLEELELAGFITRDYTWDIKTGQDKKLSRYRLSDNYLRFYLRYIDKYYAKIKRNNFAIKTLTSLPEWCTIMGLQFENLVLNNRKMIHEQLNLRAEDIISDNPFFQTAISRQPGCQIDYMIQTKFDTLYLCEIKFSRQVIGTEILEEIEQKIARLKRPKGFSIRPVLIHVNGVSETVIESDFFCSIIAFGDLFKH